MNLSKFLIPTAVIVVGFLLFVSIRTCTNNKQQLQELRDMNKALRDTTRYWQNKADEEVASRRVVEGSLKNMESFFTKEDARELQQRFNIDLKDLKSLVKLTSQGHTTLPPASKPQVVYIDSSGPCPVITAMQQRFENPYYKLDVRVGQDAFAKLLAFDTTTIVVKRAFTRRFLSKQWFTQVDAISANDSIRNTIQGAFVIKDTYQRNTVEVFGHAGYRYFKAIPGASGSYGGIGATYNLGRLSVSGSYNTLIGEKGRFVEGSVRITALRL